MMVGTPDYQFLKDFIDVMVGILFILLILRITLACVKYILSPVILLFKGLFSAGSSVKDMCKNYVEAHEENDTKVTVNNPIKTECKNENELDNSNVIDFNKIKRN